LEEKAQVALEQIRQQLASEDVRSAAEVLTTLHPADGADVLLALEEENMQECGVFLLLGLGTLALAYFP